MLTWDLKDPLKHTLNIEPLKHTLNIEWKSYNLGLQWMAAVWHLQMEVIMQRMVDFK